MDAAVPSVAMSMHGGSGGSTSIILSSREEAVPHVVAWLAQTYGEKEGATMLKKHVYQAYVSFCGENNFECTNAASFGKIFKRVFPRVQMARLVVDKGKKGWHYSGLTLRRTTSHDGRGGHHLATNASLDESMDADERVAGRRRRRERRPPSPTQGYQQSFRLVSADRTTAPTLVESSYTHHALPAAHTNGPTSSSTPHMSLGHILSASSATTDPLSFAPGHSFSPIARASPSYTTDEPTELRSKRKRSLEQEIVGHGVAKPTADEYAGRRDSSGEYVPLSVDTKRPKSNIRPFDVSPAASNPMSPASTSFPTDHNSHPQQAVAGRSGIWNSNAHLYLIETLHQYSRVFRQESWAAFPINPACLKLSNMQYLITSDDGALERSPLALCAYFALACGSLVVGNLQRSREFWFKSRELLGELFDSNDYDVACVLRHSANLSRVLDESEGRMAKGFYYLTMSKQICERIGAVNDENYELTLKMISAYYRVPVDAEMEYAQTQPKWNKNWKEGKICVSQYKYGRITEVIKDYTMECIQGITAATCGDLSPQEKRRKLLLELVKMDKLEEATDRADNHYGGTPRQLLQIIRALHRFFRAVALQHIGTPQEALASNVAFIEFLTKRLHTSSFFISWTEISSMPVFAREMPRLLCALLDDQRLALLQALFHRLEPLTKELDWLRTTYDSLRAVVDSYYASHGLQPPSLLTSSLPPPPPPPHATTTSSTMDPSSTLTYLPLSSSSLTSSTSPVPPSSSSLPSRPAALPPSSSSLAHLLAL